MSSTQIAFITYLEGIRDSADQSRARAILATLRRGLGKEPWQEAEMLRYIVPWLPQEPNIWRERPYFLIASLFAFFPEEGGEGDMGKHFSAIRHSGQNPDAIERRFTALLQCHSEDIPYHLRQAISLCKANRIPVNWHQLFQDVTSWGHPMRRVQRSWSRSFWGREPEATLPSKQATEA